MERFPQFPHKCNIPDARAAEQRRLVGGGISKDEAAKACAHWKIQERGNCIADVMATNDLSMANTNGY